MSNPTCLSIVEGAYRATLEEQDDAALWFNAAVRNSGSDTNVLLKDLAVHYALAGQTAPTLNVGDVTVDRPWNCPHEEACTKHDVATVVEAVMADKPTPAKAEEPRVPSVLGVAVPKAKAPPATEDETPSS